MLGSVINWYFRQRYEDLQQQTLRAVEDQQELLDYLLEMGSETEYGDEYGFKQIRNYESFRSQVPIVEYEDLRPWIERTLKGEQRLLWPGEITWFAKSSGTTSNSAKFIPISYECLEETHFRGGRDMVTLHCAQHPETNAFQGKALIIGGSYRTNPENPKSFSGDLSAVLWAHLPAWANLRSTPEPNIAMMESWEKKLEPMAQAVIKENVTSITGVPTWVIVLFKRVLEITGKSNIHEVWPNLEVFFHGGVNFNPYREQFKKFLPGPMSYLETYNASEGFFGLQFESGLKEFTLLTHHGIFYEFQPLGAGNEACVPLWEVQPGVNYAIIISTNSGLWRYRVGDTVRFSSTQPYNFTITGRTRLFINAFGEELMVENADTAITETCRLTGATIADYTAAPIYLSSGKGGHEWCIEFIEPPHDVDEFTQILDSELRKCNGDYDAKRLGDLAMHMPIIHSVPKGVFQSWLKSKGKLGVQNKIPRLCNDRNVIDEILGMLQPQRA